MKTYKSVRATGTVLAVLTAACGAAPGAGSGASSAPTASPTQSAVTQPSASPSAAPATAYLDDRSSAEQVIRSYYDAIGRRQYLRAYGYWEPSTTLPTFEAFAKGFEATTLGSGGARNGRRITGRGPALLERARRGPLDDDHRDTGVRRLLHRAPRSTGDPDRTAI